MVFQEPVKVIYAKNVLDGEVVRGNEIDIGTHIIFLPFLTGERERKGKLGIQCHGRSSLMYQTRVKLGPSLLAYTQAYYFLHIFFNPRLHHQKLYSIKNLISTFAS